MTCTAELGYTSTVADSCSSLADWAIATSNDSLLNSEKWPSDSPNSLGSPCCFFAYCQTTLFSNLAFSWVDQPPFLWGCENEQTFRDYRMSQGLSALLQEQDSLMAIALLLQFWKKQLSFAEIWLLSPNILNFTTETHFLEMKLFTTFKATLNFMLFCGSLCCAGLMEVTSTYWVATKPLHTAERATIPLMKEEMQGFYINPNAWIFFG